jgi:hypothetical protein
MRNRFVTAMVLLGICLAEVPWVETVPTGCFYESNVPIEKYCSGRPTYFAQNDQKKSSDNASTHDTSKITKDTEKPKRSIQETGVPKKTKPMKPFVPSEKIPADQGVDLPYDI